MAEGELTDFDALMRFRSLDDAQRMEQLFLSQRENLREARATTTRLDYLNSTTKDTKVNLDAHIGMHDQAQASIDYLKIWSARGTALIVLVVGIIGGVAASTAIIRFMQGG